MDWEAFTDDVWSSVNESTYTAQWGDLGDSEYRTNIVFTIGETWQGALYGTEENAYGQKVVQLFHTEEDQHEWFKGVTEGMGYECWCGALGCEG